MFIYAKIKTIWAASLVASVFFVSGCVEDQKMNTVEFEPHLERPYRAKDIYGVGFIGYENPQASSNFRLLGWKQGALTSHSYHAKLVHIGPPKVLLSSKDGEEHLVPLKWVGEVPPREFDGKLFIRIYDLEEGLIHWDPDPLARWDP